MNTDDQIQQLCADLAAARAEAEMLKNAMCVNWFPRGVGIGGNHPDLRTGERNGYGPDLSGFVRSKAEGALAVAIFGGNAFLDYRDFEPDWIQVKVRCDEETLLRLCALVIANARILTPAIVARALAPAAGEVLPRDS